jgi:hypothetical protein
MQNIEDIISRLEEKLLENTRRLEKNVSLSKGNCKFSQINTIMPTYYPPLIDKEKLRQRPEWGSQIVRTGNTKRKIQLTYCWSFNREKNRVRNKMR